MHMLIRGAMSRSEPGPPSASESACDTCHQHLTLLVIMVAPVILPVIHFS